MSSKTISSEIFETLKNIKLSEEETEAVKALDKLWDLAPRIARVIEPGLIKAIKSRKPNLLSEDI